MTQPLPTPCVRFTRVRFLEDDVFEGSIPQSCYDDASVEEYDVDRDEDLIESAARLIEREGLTFEATGNEWAASPDGSRIVDYAAGEREETTAHLVWFTDDEIAAVVDRIG